MKVDILEQDKKFLESQLKNAKKQARLLKVAISKIQNDYDVLSNRNSQSSNDSPLKLTYPSNHNPIMLSQLDKILTENQDFGKDDYSQKLIGKLEKANAETYIKHPNAKPKNECDQLKRIAETKIKSFSVYTDENKLKDLLLSSKNETLKENQSSKVNKSSKSQNRSKNIRNRKHFFSTQRHTNTDKLPVGSPQNVSQIKRKLGDNQKWNEF